MSKINLPPLPTVQVGGKEMSQVWFRAHEVRAYAEQAVREDRAERMNDGYASLRLWWAMVEADSEFIGKRIPDDATILHFMGNGASHQVTARDIRNALSCVSHPQEPPCSPTSSTGASQ